jgi:sugar O-acyltransferase (sialic acid O-acetyltransferase NeuD family)
MKKKVIIFGIGELAEIAYFYLAHDSDYQIVAFTADKEYIKKSKFLKLPLVPFDQIEKLFPSNIFQMFIALSYRKLNTIRAQKYYEAKKKKYKLISYINSKATFWPGLKIGDNVFIFENNVIQPFVTIGNNTTLWSGNHIGHGTKIETHCFISSHVVIAGNVVVGNNSFLGINSAIRDGVKIAPETFVAMGANVVSDTQRGDVVLSSRGIVFKAESREAQSIKKKYFGF